MSDFIVGFSIFLLVLSPMFVPVAITLYGWVSDWRTETRARRRRRGVVASVNVGDARGHADVHRPDPQLGAVTG